MTERAILSKKLSNYGLATSSIWQSVLPVGIVAFTFLIVLLLCSLAYEEGVSEKELFRLENQIASYGSKAAFSYLEDHKVYRRWLESYATLTEYQAFIIGSMLIHSSVGNFSSSRAVSLSRGLSFAFVRGLTRLLFVISATSRFLILVIVVTFVFSRRNRKEKEGRGFLSHFTPTHSFSGSYTIKFASLGSDEMPDMQLPGLVAVPVIGPESALPEKIKDLFLKYSVHSVTAKHLAEIIASSHDAGLFNSTLHFLETFLDAHSTCSSEDHVPSGKQQTDLRRILSAKERKSLCEIKVDVLASLVLSLQAAKTCIHEKRGLRNVQVSNNVLIHEARAMLHSAPALGDDFSLEERQILRRALVFSKNHGNFGMPTDMSDIERGLSKWVAYLVAPKMDLIELADQLELTTLMRSAYDRWIMELPGLMVRLASDPGIGAFATKGMFLFMPLKQLVPFLRRAIPRDEAFRISYLSELIFQREQIAEMQRDEDSFEVSRSITRALRDSEIRELADRNGVALEDLADWSIYRMILSEFGWLPEWIGTSKVPESDVFVVNWANNESTPQLVESKEGMIALSGEALSQRLGKNWSKRFIDVPHVAVSTAVPPKKVVHKDSKKLKEVTIK